MALAATVTLVMVDMVQAKAGRETARALADLEARAARVDMVQAKGAQEAATVLADLDLEVRGGLLNPVKAVLWAAVPARGMLSAAVEAEHL